MNDERLRKSIIIRSQSEFEELFKTGKRVYGQYVFIIYKPLPPETEIPCRIAFVTGRRIGNAVIRNRSRRRLKEIFRKHQDLFLQYRSLMIAQKAITRASFAELNDDVLTTIKKITKP